MKTETYRIIVPVTQDQIVDEVTTDNAESLIIAIDRRICDVDFTSTIIQKLAKSLTADVPIDEILDGIRYYCGATQPEGAES